MLSIFDNNIIFQSLMEHPNPETFPIYTTSWEQMFNQLLFAYYQLSENYRTAVNRNFELQQQLGEKMLILNQMMNQEHQSKLKCETKATLPEQIPHIDETSSIKEKKEKQPSSKRRRFQRKKKQSISNQYICTYSDCQRAYDSSVSLNLHIKLKHNGGTKKQRQTYAKMILDAEQKGAEPPKINITFPPNFIEEFKTSYEYMKKYSM